MKGAGPPAGPVMAASKLLPLVSAPAVDPVCGMTVDPATARFHADHDGRRFYFCCGGCMAKFKADPAKYLAPTVVTPGHGADPHAGHAAHAAHGAAAPAPAVPVPADAEYTCPMHPEIRQRGPGSCPICGMALEPVMPGAAGDDDS